MVELCYPPLSEVCNFRKNINMSAMLYIQYYFEVANFKERDSSFINGGAWTKTAGGHKQVLMQSFDYGSDSTNGEGVTRFHCISNSTFNDGSGAYPGDC